MLTAYPSSQKTLRRVHALRQRPNALLLDRVHRELLQEHVLQVHTPAVVPLESTHRLYHAEPYYKLSPFPTSHVRTAAVRVQDELDRAGELEARVAWGVAQRPR